MFCFQARAEKQEVPVAPVNESHHAVASSVGISLLPGSNIRTPKEAIQRALREPAQPPPPREAYRISQRAGIHDTKSYL